MLSTKTQSTCAFEQLETRRLMSGDLTSTATAPLTTDSAHTGAILVALGDGSVRHHGENEIQVKSFHIGETQVDDLSADPDEGGEVAFNHDGSADPDGGGEVTFSRYGAITAR